LGCRAFKDSVEEPFLFLRNAKKLKADDCLERKTD